MITNLVCSSCTYTNLGVLLVEANESSRDGLLVILLDLWLLFVLFLLILLLLLLTLLLVLFLLLLVILVLLLLFGLIELMLHQDDDIAHD
jgi:hypothetical protein